MKCIIVLGLLVVSVPTLSTGQDLQLASTIEHILRTRLQIDGPLTSDHLKSLTALSVDQREIKSFSGLEFAPKLVSLRIYSCQIGDFNSISALAGLRELHVRNCGIRDVSPLARLTNLSHLSLTDNQITDISGLSNCTELAWLDLSNNKIDSIPALSQLCKLLCVDLRGNPLKDSAKNADADIQVIMANNPDVTVLVGRQSDLTQTDLVSRLSASATIADFALWARFQYFEELARPLLPLVSSTVTEALAFLRRRPDKQYLADVATVFMRYAIEIDSNYRPGALLSRDNPHPLLAVFLDELHPKLYGDEITTGAIAYWIRNNRDKLPPSVVLDTEIKRYHGLYEELRRKGILLD